MVKQIVTDNLVIRFKKQPLRFNLYDVYMTDLKLTCYSILLYRKLSTNEYSFSNYVIILLTFNLSFPLPKKKDKYNMSCQRFLYIADNRKYIVCSRTVAVYISLLTHCILLTTWFTVSTIFTI